MRLVCPAALLLCLLASLAAGLRADEAIYGYPARWVLSPPDAQGLRVITRLVPLNANQSPVPEIPLEGAALNEVKRILNQAKDRIDRQPLAENRLLDLLGSIDPSRQWRQVKTGVPGLPGTVLIVYQHPAREFVVHLGIADHPGETQALPLSSGVVARVGDGVLDEPELAAAALSAARQALAIAQQRGAESLAPMIAETEQDQLSRDLAARFQLPGLTVPQSKYLLQGRPSGATLAASDLWVDPVFIPRRIAIELKNWKLEEVGQPPAVVRELQVQRAREEEKVRRQLDGVIPAGRQLVTTADVQRWTESPLGRRLSLAPLRQEDDVLVLEAATDVPRLAFVLSLGASYGATAGAQGTTSLHVVRDFHSHLDVSAEAAAGAEARSAKTALRWAPLRPVRGWTLSVDGSGEVRRQDEAYFGAATAAAPAAWRQGRGQLAARALRVQDAQTTAAWARAWLAQLTLAHTDDRFAGAAAPALATLDRPDTTLAATAEAEFKRTTRSFALTLHPSLRAVRALSALDGGYDYRLAEAALTASAITSFGDLPWKLVAGARLGRIRGDSPASAAFRAGGDDGWIRGLREGEVAGARYHAQSFAVGPEVSRLLGEENSRRPSCSRSSTGAACATPARGAPCAAPAWR
ncbi:hypothetical protein [Oleiharenicola sp. Vm1]|uniref:hypothetical protein n=1 Tax=Oleiharenicola sp. Vm1 TaxID=3398393 RepID=UPI0039F50B25